jgi:hypothetical protein
MRWRRDHAAWPWAWVLLIPFLTVPTTLILWQGWLVPQCRVAPGPAPSPYTCPGNGVAMALLPGLLNLVPFTWIVCEARSTRLAALLAGGLGAIRWLVPTVLHGATQPSVTIHPIDALLQILVNLGLWVLTLCLGAGFWLWSLRYQPGSP